VLAFRSTPFQVPRDAKKASKAIKEKLRRGQTTIGKEYKAIVQAERHAQALHKIKELELKPDGPFEVVIVDRRGNTTGVHLPEQRLIRQ
jgi:hypothetical protein